MTRNELLYKICPTDTTFDCRTGNKSCNCYDCGRVLEEWLCDYDKYVIEQYKADTNLKDTIKDIHDNVSHEMYCKGIDEFLAKVKEKYPTAKNALYYLTRIAEELKAGGKNEMQE